MRPKTMIILGELIRVAKACQTITYGDLANRAGLSFPLQLAPHLNEIGEQETANGRPLLTAIVVSKDKQMSGEGFFALARQGRLSVDTDPRTFWESELKKVHNYWSQQK